MTALLFTGCALIAWAFPALVFLAFVVHRPQLLVTFFCAVFFALLAFLFGSFFWLFISPAQEYTVLQSLFYAIIIELVRFWFLFLLSRTAKNFAAVGTNSIGHPMVPFYTAIATGLGFGVVQALVLYGEFIIDAYGPAAVFNTNACSNRTTFIDAAVMSLYIALFNLPATIVTQEAYENADGRVAGAGYAATTVLHGMVLFSPAISYGTDFCLGVFILPAVFIAMILVPAVFIATQDEYASRKHAKRPRDLTE